jgi:hypothetical protein
LGRSGHVAGGTARSERVYARWQGPIQFAVVDQALGKWLPSHTPAAVATQLDEAACDPLAQPCLKGPKFAA